jgi:hypothetical protein
MEEALECASAAAAADPTAAVLDVDTLWPYYSGLLRKYFPNGDVLQW